MSDLLRVRLAQLRAEAAITQKDLAAEADVAVATLSDIERGAPINPRLGTLEKIAAVLGRRLGRPIEVTDLLADEPAPAKAVNG